MKKKKNIYSNSLITIAYITIHKKRIAIKNKIQNYCNLTGFSFIHTKTENCGDSAWIMRGPTVECWHRRVDGVCISLSQINRKIFVTNAIFLSYRRMLNHYLNHLETNKNRHEIIFFCDFSSNHWNGNLFFR